jgi:hypothetical protein
MGETETGTEAFLSEEGQKKLAAAQEASARAARIRESRSRIIGRRGTRLTPKPEVELNLDDVIGTDDEVKTKENIT